MSSATVSRTVSGRVAIVTIDAAPVNALSLAVRNALVDAFVNIAADTSVDAVVLHGQGGCFSAGADIREFEGGTQPPDLHDVMAAMRAANKPVIAAIERFALGGGLELALACDLRVASPQARLGLPEIKIGLIPGAGGTQRLPRIVGIGPALDMILSGEPVSGARALEMGLVGAVADKPLPEAVRLAAQGVARVGDVDAPAIMDNASMARARDRKPPKGVSPRAWDSAIAAVAAAAQLRLADGIVREAELFAQCAASSEAAALQYRFWAEREAAKPPTSSAAAGAETSHIAAIGVVGSGTMGTDIALAFLLAGHEVRLADRDLGALERGRARIDRGLASATAKGRITADTAQDARSRLRCVTDLADLAGSDLVIEAVFESLEVKRAVFRELDRVLPPHTILVSNTSTLDLDAISAATNRTDRVAGLHFFVPAHVMKLVEIVRGRHTAPECILALTALAKRMGKTVVHSGNAWGFIANRTFEPYVRACNRLLLDGVMPQTVDAALTGFGMAMGYFAVTDLSGNDVRAALIAEQTQSMPAAEAARLREDFAVLLALVERGRMGMKAGMGFYRFGPDGRTPIPDLEVQALIHEMMKRRARPALAMDDEAIVFRCFDAVVNEAYRAVEQGIAARVSDIDVAWVNGFGYPVLKGGPVHHARATGLSALVLRLQERAEAEGAPDLAPCALLRQEAAARG